MITYINNKKNRWMTYDWDGWRRNTNDRKVGGEKKWESCVHHA